MGERKYCIAVKYGPNGADKRYYYKRGRVLFTAKEALDFVEETIATQEGFTEDDFEIIDESV